MGRGSFTKTLIVLTVAPLLASCTVVPDPYTPQELAQIAQNDKELIFASQESLGKNEVLSLERAFAMALKYNLENRVVLLEETLSNDSFDLSKTDLLPDLAANAGYLDRTNPNASFSNSIRSGNISLEPSTSQDEAQTNNDIRFTWNLLDFGVSYLTAKQGADNFIIAQKAREKVMLTLLQEVRSAYWYAVAMVEMETELEDIYDIAELTLRDLEISRNERLQNPITVLTEIRTMVETLQVLDRIRQSINTSRTRLATLINVQSYEPLILQVPESFTKLYRVSNDTESMEAYALANSADYMTEVYNVRIEQDETRKAMLRLLPGLEFSYGENYSSNSFLLNDQWGQMGVNLSADLMRLFNTGTIRKFRETSEQLTISRKLAVNMAVVAGVNITWQDYQNSLLQNDRAALLNEIDAELFLLTGNQEVNATGTRVATIQSMLRAFRSEIGELESYAAAQTAYGAYMTSLGVNPIPNNYQAMSVADLASSISEGFVSSIEPFMALNAIEDRHVLYKNGRLVLDEMHRVRGNLLENDLTQAVTRITSVEDSKGNAIVLGSDFTTDSGNSLIINSDGSYLYTLSTDSIGSGLELASLEEAFTYTVTDAEADEDKAELTIVAFNNVSLETKNLQIPGPDLQEYLDIMQPADSIPNLDEYLELFRDLPEQLN